MSSGKDIKIGEPDKTEEGYPLNRARPDIKVEQPPNTRMKTSGNPIKITRKEWNARKIMAHNGYDPIRELLQLYYQLERELEFYDQWRANKIKPLTATGRHRTYNQEVHMNLYDKLMNIHDKLLRYGYGRVPENVVNMHKEPKRLTIVMHDENKSFSVEEDKDDITEITDGEIIDGN